MKLLFRRWDPSTNFVDKAVVLGIYPTKKQSCYVRVGVFNLAVLLDFVRHTVLNVASDLENESRFILLVYLHEDSVMVSRCAKRFHTEDLVHCSGSH